MNTRMIKKEITMNRFECLHKRAEIYLFRRKKMFLKSSGGVSQNVNAEQTEAHPCRNPEVLRNDREWRIGRPSLNASFWGLAWGPSGQSWGYSGLYQSLWEGTKTEEQRYLAYKVEMPTRGLKGETGGRSIEKRKGIGKILRRKGNQGRLKSKSGKHLLCLRPSWPIYSMKVVLSFSFSEDKPELWDNVGK